MATRFRYGIFEKKHIDNIKKQLKTVEELFDKTITEGVRIGESSGFNDPKKPFYFSDYPVVKERIDKLLISVNKSMQGIIETGDRENWLLSCEKNDEMVDSVTSSTGIPKDVLTQWKQPNLEALSAFQLRKAAGMALSERVWNITEQLKQELELALDIGLGSGKSAAELSRDVRKYLNEPERLFRRVRDKHGNLRLSKNARAYHPGQGVYRSSYKNALRLTATENNMAYRKADSERWQQIPFVIGIRISVSHNNHPIVDICDELQGVYPKDFIWMGWHPFCKCAAVAVLAKREEFLDYQRKLLAGEDVSKYKFSGAVDDVPSEFKNWLVRNEERVKTTTTIPYFIRDNGKYVPKKWVDGIGSLAKGRDRGILTDIKETIYKKIDPTYVTEKDVKRMITDFAKAEPGLFYGGLSEVSISKSKSAFMENIRYINVADGSYVIKRGNTITLHNYNFTVNRGEVFNPVHEVKGAMKAIAEKRPLTFNEEYAIESLWHEIRHAQAVGWKDVRIKRKNPHLIDAMECINQFCARRSYGKLLRAIGGTVTHRKEIIQGGYGYSRMVGRFESLLKAINVSSSEAYVYFKPLIVSVPYEEVFDRVVGFLMKKGVKKEKAETLIKTLRHSDSLFEEALKGV